MATWQHFFKGRSYYPTRTELMEAGFVVLMEVRGVVVMGAGERRRRTA